MSTCSSKLCSRSKMSSRTQLNPRELLRQPVAGEGTGREPTPELGPKLVALSVLPVTLIVFLFFLDWDLYRHPKPQPEIIAGEPEMSLNMTTTSDRKKTTPNETLTGPWGLVTGPRTLTIPPARSTVRATMRGLTRGGAAERHLFTHGGLSRRRELPLTKVQTSDRRPKDSPHATKGQSRVTPEGVRSLEMRGVGSPEEETYAPL